MPDSALPEPFQLSRRAGWRRPAGGVHVARPGFWGNWISVGDPGSIVVRYGTSAGPMVSTIVLLGPVAQAQAVAWHAGWLDGADLLADPEFCALVPAAAAAGLDDLLARHRAATLNSLWTLRGKRLGCWCSLPARAGAPDLCHRATLAARANAETLTCTAA